MGAINAADPNTPAQPGRTDIDGDPRVLLGRLDMGADEVGAADFADCNDNDISDWQDLVDGTSDDCNKNGIPFDPEKPFVTSGVRLGTPAATTRGFGADEFNTVGELIGQVLDGLAANPDDNSAAEGVVREQVKELCGRFPIYSDM